VVQEAHGAVKGRRGGTRWWGTMIPHAGPARVPAANPRAAETAAKHSSAPMTAADAGRGGRGDRRSLSEAACVNILRF